jgi:ketosteroid isomerase-like protein
MSRESVEIAKRGIDAFNRRDVDSIVELATADFEWFPALPETVEGSGYRGREGIETYLIEVHDTWEEYRLVADEFRDLGDRVLMLGRIEGRGRGSGVNVDTPWGGIFDFRDGRVWRVRSYLDHGDALRAAGLFE